MDEVSEINCFGEILIRIEFSQVVNQLYNYNKTLCTC